MRMLIERHQSDLMRFLTRLTGETAGAEDVFQEAFLQAHVAAHTFDAERRFRPWLFTIAANKARDYLRRRVRRRTLDLSAPMDGGGAGGDGSSGSFIDLMEVDIPAPDDAMQRRETSVKVQGILDALPYSLREILLLAYFQRRATCRSPTNSAFRSAPSSPACIRRWRRSRSSGRPRPTRRPLASRRNDAPTPGVR